jgi:hypothetical protein
MEKNISALLQLPPRTITTAARQRRSAVIFGAVERFAAAVPLTPLQRHMLGLIVDETIEMAAPKATPITVGEASNDAGNSIA